MSCATPSRSPSRCARDPPRRDGRRLVAWRPRAPRGWSRHGVRGARRSPRRARRSCPRARGCSSAASRRTRHQRRPRTPPGSATSRVQWVVSACCGTSRAGGSWRSAAARGPTTTSTISSPTPPRPRTPACSSTRATSDSSRPPTWNTSWEARRNRARRRARATVVRTAVESMAATTVRVVESIPVDDGSRPVRGVRVFGGGSRSPLYLDALRRRTELPVSVGPVEATAVGNALGPGCRVGCLRGRARSAGDSGRPAGSRAMNVQALERLELMRHRLDTEGRVRVAGARRRTRRERDDDPA